MNPERPLPARLKLDAQYETWCPAAELEGVRHPERKAHVRLTSGHTVRSRLNKNVPPVGYIAGGGS